MYYLDSECECIHCCNVVILRCDFIFNLICLTLIVSIEIYLKIQLQIGKEKYDEMSRIVMKTNIFLNKVKESILIRCVSMKIFFAKVGFLKIFFTNFILDLFGRKIISSLSPILFLFILTLSPA